MRCLGLDLGTRTLGLAMSDKMNMIASPYRVLRWDGEDYNLLFNELDSIIRDNGITDLVLGLPKNMNATEGVRVELTMEFKEKLERRTGLPVHLWDERLTTVAADKAMMEAGVRREKRKDYVDMIAATLILQGYLDLRANETKE